jgi:mercuric reductase
MPAPADMAALTGGKDDLVTAMRAAKYAGLAADYGWEIVAGTARFTGHAGEPRLEVTVNDRGTQVIEAANYLVATGAAPWIPPIRGLAEAGYLTSASAMEVTGLPESMLVIGGNAVGLELGQLFARLGARVTIAEALDRLAPFEEPEVSAAIEDVFNYEGIGILTAATITSARRDATGRSVAIKTAAGRERELACGQILVAAGRRAVTGGLNLQAAGVKTGGHGEIVTDEFQRTANPRIWAAGDVTGGPQFVYVTAAQGTAPPPTLFLRGSGGRPLGLALHAGRTVDYAVLPRVTFTSPAIASAGLTEAQLVRQGVACDCRVLPLEAVPRAVVSRDTRGVIKLVAEAGAGRVRGAHVVADGAGDVITAAGYAIRARMTVTDLADTWAPYLTMSEGLKLAARAFSRDVSRPAPGRKTPRRAPPRRFRLRACRGIASGRRWRWTGARTTRRSR